MRTPLVLVAALLAVTGLVVPGCAEADGSGFLRVLDPHGEPVALDRDNAILFSRARESGVVTDQLSIFTDSEERLRVPAAYDGEEMVLLVGGYRELILPGDPSIAEVRLESGYPVRLRLEPGAGLPPDPLHLAAFVHWRGPGDAPGAEVLHQFSYTVQFMEGKREAELSLPVPGRYRVVWAARHHWGTPQHSRTETHIPPGAGMSFVLEDRSEEQVFTLPIDPASLETAVKAMNR